jgi:dCTP deaminase
LTPDREINRRRFITPFFETLHREETTGMGEMEKVISYGLSSYGYDARLGFDFMRPRYNLTGPNIVDPKKPNPDLYEEFSTEEPFVISPHSFVLAATIEYFRIPRDTLAICIGKSTYARCGVLVNVTPLEPEWEGIVTLEISNGSPFPTILYPGEGICQFIFLRSNETCKTSYKDRKGKYMDQQTVTLGKV